MSFDLAPVAALFAALALLVVLFAYSLRHHWWDENSDW
jgi:hypothetical protein